MSFFFNNNIALEVFNLVDYFFRLHWILVAARTLVAASKGYC